MPDFSGANFSSQEEPVGVIDGINRQFTLKNRPIAESETITKDGMYMARASSVAFLDGDYFIDADAKTLLFSPTQIPEKDNVIRASYKYMKTS